jgi:type IV pilus assembly protein PilB
VERVSSDVIKRVAVKDGMITLRQEGLEKVRLGLTSLQEVLRVVA